MPIVEVKLKSGREGYRWGATGTIYPTREQAEKQAAAAHANGFTGDSLMAFDEASRRRVDENGYLHVTQTHLTKEQVAPYLGKEIPGWDELGLDPEKVYFGYRPAQELEKAKDAFNGMPLLIIHQQDGADNPLKELRVGSIGTTPVWNSPYLDNALTVTDQAAIDGIHNGTLRQISCGYFFTPDFTPGEFNGVHFDFVLRNLRGNHVALVKEGRAGPDVYVHDELPSQLRKVKRMQFKRTEVALRASLATYLKPRLAQDAAPADLTKLISSYKKPAAIAKAAKRKYSTQIIQDMDIEPDELAELMEAAEQVVEPEESTSTEPAFDEENPAESLKAILEGKISDELLQKVMACCAPVTGDEISEEEKAAKAEADKVAAEKKAAEEKDEKEKKDAPAMDAALIKQQATTEAQNHFRSLYAAATRVKPLVGDLDAMAFDSAAEIYGHALKQSGKKPEKYDKAAWQGMVDMLIEQAPTGLQRIVLDSATQSEFDGEFSGLGRIKINN